MSAAEPPLFEIGQAVLVDQGLPGKVTDIRWGSVPGVLGGPPSDTWLYNVEPKGNSAAQINIPEYNLMAARIEAEPISLARHAGR